MWGTPAAIASPAPFADLGINRDEEALDRHLHDSGCLFGQLRCLLPGEAENQLVVDREADVLGVSSPIEFDQGSGRDVSRCALDEVVQGGVDPVAIHWETPARAGVDVTGAAGLTLKALGEALDAGVGLPERLDGLLGFDL